MLSDKEIMRLANGSDIRGIAIEGVEGENVNFVIVNYPETYVW